MPAMMNARTPLPASFSSAIVTQRRALIDHHSFEQFVTGVIASHDLVGFALVHPTRIHTVASHVGLKLIELVVLKHCSPAEVGDPPAPGGIGDYRDEALPGDIAPHDDDVGAIELRTIQEFAPATLTSMDIGGVVDAHAHQRRLSRHVPGSGSGGRAGGFGQKDVVFTRAEVPLS